MSRVLDVQFEEDGEVFDLNYLPSLIREVDHLLESEAKGELQNVSSQVQNSLDTLRHVRDMLRQENPK